MYNYDGFCNICNKNVIYTSANDWYRDYLRCPLCSSMVRQRALIFVLQNELKIDIDKMVIHESSPSHIIPILQNNTKYCYSHYFEKVKSGEYYNNCLCVDLMNIPFKNNYFDLFITFDVFEHLFDPMKVINEIYRVLNDDGIYIMTFPMESGFKPTEKACVLENNKPIFIETDRSKLKHLTDVEYHGNPVSNKGCVVTYYYGYDILNIIEKESKFKCDIFFHNKDIEKYGIMGVYNEVIVCYKNKNRQCMNERPTVENITECKKKFYANCEAL